MLLIYIVETLNTSLFLLEFILCILISLHSYSHCTTLLINVVGAELLPCKKKITLNWSILLFDVLSYSLSFPPSDEFATDALFLLFGYFGNKATLQSQCNLIIFNLKTP